MIVRRVARGVAIVNQDAIRALRRILDTPANGLIHLQAVAQLNVAAILPSAGPRSLPPLTRLLTRYSERTPRAPETRCPPAARS